MHKSKLYYPQTKGGMSWVVIGEDNKLKSTLTTSLSNSTSLNFKSVQSYNIPNYDMLKVAQFKHSQQDSVCPRHN